MPQLLLEILSEEIPARMQAKAEADLVKALMDGLTGAGLIPEGIKGFSGPRRLVAVVEGLPVKSADVVEDIQGPKEGAPQPAIDGFLRKAGLKSISEAHLHDVPKKGRIYVAHVKKPGKETAALIAALVPSIIRNFHWPKSMRWGSGDLRWVRPISRILCTFDGEVVPFEVDGIKSDSITEGHRVMGRGPYKVRRFEDYEDVLKNKGRVILDREERKEIILTEAKQICAAQNLELVDDIGLLEEVAGLAEYPVVIIGDMDKSFLDLPPEVIRLSMRTHQKYFAVRYPQEKGGADAKLAPKFIVVANLDAEDGGVKIAEGNSRVLSARLNDARFFWDNDRKVSLESRFDKLGNIVFHEKLGTVKDKAERVVSLAEHLSLKLVADAATAKALAKEAGRAARLSKCDLVSEMVGEFPELEGVMGRYYATLQNEPQAIADAVRDHYKPKGPGDEIPSNPVSVVVALADKFDTICAFWRIGEKPTGSRDPYALRRAGLGIIRIILQNELRLSLIMESAHVCISQTSYAYESPRLKELEWFANGLPQDAGVDLVKAYLSDFVRRNPSTSFKEEKNKALLDRSLEALAIAGSVRDFLLERLRVQLREQGGRHDLVNAAFVLPKQGIEYEGVVGDAIDDDIVRVVRKVNALGAFLETEDGKNLLAGSKRAANILKAEEKGGEKFEGKVDAGKLQQAEEKALHAALEKAAPEASAALEKEDFAGAMRALSKLRGPVDAFFDKVTVNADDKDLRANRLRLLAQIRDALNRVADFSKIEG